MVEFPATEFSVGSLPFLLDMDTPGNFGLSHPGPQSWTKEETFFTRPARYQVTTNSA